MNLPIRTVAAIILVLTVILALVASAADIFGQEGKNIEDASKTQGGDLGCVFNNPEDTEKCKTSSFKTFEQGEISV